ncbi:MAG: RNA methyltransferase [Verrucomicrobia bacterium]|nr:RNA methyltransferase [Verrucomicrobiota bacterium]
MSNVLDNIRIVMVGSIYGGNVGSVCRAMSNMGFADLALVAPQSLNMDEARKMACHASEILASRTEFATLGEAVKDCGIVVGTTAREGLYRKHSSSPREIAGKVLAVAATGRVAYVFGREDDGLSNEELALCTHVVKIPTAPVNTSLNVAQAAMICCYELFIASGLYEPPQEKSPEATSEVKERMFEIWRETLLQIGFMKDDKADHMMFGLRRILSRGKLTINDVKIMMGIARQTQWFARKAGGEEPPDTDSSNTGTTDQDV